MAFSRRCLKTSFAILAVLSAPQQASPQIAEVVTAGAIAAIGKRTVGSVLDEITQSVANIGNIVNNDFNLDFGNAYTVLQSGAEGVWYSLDKERSRIVNDIHDERQGALLDVYALSQSMLKKDIPFQQAKLKVDTLAVLNHVKLLGKKTPFMITLIDPTVVTYKDNGDYDITVLGIGIGNNEGQQIPTTVKMKFSDATPIDIKSENIPDGIRFSIRGSLLISKFGESKFNNADILIESIVPEKCGFLDMQTCRTPYSFSYTMRLFPRTAAVATFQQIRVTPSTDPATRRPLHASTVTANGNGNHMLQWASPVISASPGWQIVGNVDVQCGNYWQKPGNPCAFLYFDNGAMQPQNGGVSAHATGSNNSWPLKLEFTAWEEKTTTASTTLPPFSVPFAAGESKPVKLQNDAASVLADVATVTGNKSLVQVVPPGGSVLSPIVCGGRTDIGGDLVQYLCTAKGIDAY